MNKISVIILNYNTPILTINCIKSIIKYSKNINYEIILVDNASQDNSKKLFTQYLKNFRFIKIIYNRKNLGYGAGLNRGIIQSQGNYLFLLNSDILFYENSLTILLKEYKTLSKKTPLALLQPRLELYTTHFPQQTASHIPTTFQILQENFRLLQRLKGNEYCYFKYANWNRNTSRYVEAACGAALFCSKARWQEIGGFDERFFMYFEEYDLAQRIKKLGYKNYYTTKTSLLHYHNVSPKPWIVKKIIYLQSFFKYLLKKY